LLTFLSLRADYFLHATFFRDALLFFVILQRVIYAITFLRERHFQYLISDAAWFDALFFFFFISHRVRVRIKQITPNIYAASSFLSFSQVTFFRHFFFFMPENVSRTRMAGRSPSALHQ